MADNKLNDRIKLLFEKVQQATDNIEESKKRIKKEWLTKAVFEINGRSFNLKFAERYDLILRLSEIVVLKTAFDKTLEILNTKDSFKLNGYVFEDVVEDFKKRLADIEMKDKEIELAFLTKQLNAIAPEDVKRERMLKELEERFNQI